MKIVLKELLEEKEISVYALSKNIGVTYKSVWKMVNRHTSSIKFEVLEKICRFLEIGISEVFDYEKQ